ncbi:hypothetical protein L7F22_008035 [Adiantum nelumboides]|nr:hypothetical protein [Adiantum nelumboides]
MRIFRTLDKMKTCIGDPSSSSVVHPSFEDEHCTPRSVNRGKVMKLLGVGGPQERQEIDSLLGRPSTSRGEHEDEDILAIHETAVALPHPHDASQPTQIVTNAASNVAVCKVFAQSPMVKTHFLQDFAASQWGLKLLKFHCLADMSLALDNPNSNGKFSSFPASTEKLENVSHNSGARQGNIFPLPPPHSEKHLLPSPKRKEVSIVGHPLPQPPLLRPPSNQPLRTQVLEVEENTTCSPASVNELGAREAAPLPPISENAKTAPIPPLETSNQCIVSMAYKLFSPSVSPKVSRRPCHLLPSPPGGGSAVNSPSPSASSKPLCLPGQGPTRNSSLPSQELKPLCLSDERSTLNSISNAPASKPLCPKKWQKGAILGQGTFGVVHEGLNLEDGSFFAVKVSSTGDVSPEIQHEVDLLSKLEHPNIVRYLGSSIEDGRLCIFIELVRMGSLEAILRKYKRFEEKTIRTYTRQILHGLEYLHAQKTIHRDIKCANILVDVNGQVKLSDFGIAKQVRETLASSSKGTPLYMAPEVLTPKHNYYSFSADIWNLGCTVLEMADGKPPWSNLEGFAFLFKVKKGELPPMPDHLSPEGKDFVCRCLKFDAKDRPTASELLQHPFMSRISSPELPVPWISPPASFPGLSSQTCRNQPLSAVAQCTL